MVKRYHYTYSEYLRGNHVVQDEKGEYVLYSDYEALAAQLETVKGERDKWKQAFAAQSRKLQAVLYIPGVKEKLAVLQGDAS